MTNGKVCVAHLNIDEIHIKGVRNSDLGSGIILDEISECVKKPVKV